MDRTCAIWIVSRAILLSIAAPLAVLAQPFTTEMDLHAAYCIAFNRGDIQNAQSLLSQLNPADPNQSKFIPIAKSALALAQANLRRLMLYEMPRESYLDASVLAAQRSAQEDIHRNETKTSVCFNECGEPGTVENALQCFADCGKREMPDLPLFEKKRDSCRDLSWLPI